MTGSLIKWGKITTTITRAKEVRKYADKMVTWTKEAAKKEDPQHEIKQMERFLYERSIVDKAMKQFPLQFKDRQGGYTRIVRTTFRKGDGAPMCTIEFLDREKINQKETPVEKVEVKTEAPTQ
jgi:large subunit ribosomal protein L17